MTIAASAGMAVHVTVDVMCGSGVLVLLYVVAVDVSGSCVAIIGVSSVLWCCHIRCYVSS